MFDFDGNAPLTPTPLAIRHIIQTNASALAHHALEEAPKGAILELNSSLYATLARRLGQFWSATIEIPPAAMSHGVEVVEETRPIEEAELDD